jgi:hypothetical protein
MKSKPGINMFRKLACSAATMLALSLLPAQAKTLAFDFETADGLFDVSGDLMTSDALDSAGGFDVTGISGNLRGPNGGSIALAPNPSQPAASLDSSGSWIYDNVVFSSGPSVDNSGLLFAAGGYDYNLYSSGLVYYLSSFNPAGKYNPGEVGRVTVTTIPESATWLTMGIGFVALGAWGRRGPRKHRVADFAWS